MNYSTNKVNNTEKDIALIKEAITAGTCTLEPTENSNDCEFIVKIFDKPPLETGSKVTMTYIYNVFNNIPLAVLGAACEEIVDIVINNGIGYKSYLKDVAKSNAVLLYFTNFPANDFTLEEINGLCTSKFNCNLIEGIFSSNGLRDFYFNFETIVRSQMSYEKEMSIHKSELTKAIDNIVKLTGGIDNEETATVVKNVIMKSINDVNYPSPKGNGFSC